jgi:polysaccharide export outer membrane protein
MVTFARNPHGMGRIVLALAVVALLGAGCTVNRDIMFKTPRDYAFDTVQDTLEREFKIQADDIISFRMYANDGFKMIDLINMDDASLRAATRNPFNYVMDPEGRVKLPVVGEVHLSGLTIRQAELLLEEKYSKYYQKPFVLLTVGNRRVVVFPGGGGDAKIIPLENNNTTLLEVLASAGGIANRGDAHRVKLFRREPTGARKVFQFDLSDIDNLKYGDLVMQADDVLYVQPNAEIARGLLTEITPLITLLTTTVLVIGLVRTIGN